MFPQYSAWSNFAIADLTVAATVADYQVKLVLDIEPEMNVTSSDILDFRACTLLGESLNYWIESVGTLTFTAWVKVPLGTQQIVYFWGNIQAVSESDGGAVFEFFDGGESGSPSDKWTLYGGLWTRFTYSSDRPLTGTKCIKLDSTVDSNENYCHVLPITTDCVIEAMMYDDATDNSLHQLVYLKGESGYDVNVGVWTGNSETYYSYINASAQWATSSVARTTGWHNIKLVVTGGNVLVYVDNTLIHTRTGKTVTQLFINSGYSSYTGVSYYDNIIIRKYQATEPTFSVVSSSYSASRVAPLFETASGTTTLEISSTVELTGSEYANILLNKFLSSEVSKTGSSTASINLAKYISSTTESTGSETANILLQKLISCSSDLAGSSTANISLQKFISSISEITGSSIAAIYLQTSDLSILAEMVGAATANISVSKSISSTADVSGNSTAKATVFKYVSSESASQIESLVNAILTKYITSETGLSGSSAVNITRYNYISSLGLIEISATATIGGGTAISLDFVYPLTVYIFLKQRTVTIQ